MKFTGLLAFAALTNNIEAMKINTGIKWRLDRVDAREQCEDIFDNFDLDHNGQIDYNEFQIFGSNSTAYPAIQNSVSLPSDEVQWANAWNAYRFDGSAYSGNMTMSTCRYQRYN